jgi:glycosyltransferase involved in cell wall biosynthesis
MKILFVSNRNPHFVNTNVYREKAIRKLGHEVIFFEDRDFVLPGRIRQKVTFLQKWDISRLNRKLVRLVAKERPDLCLVVGGFRTLAQTLVEIKELGTKTVLWTTDPPRDYANIIQTASLYDHIFCAGTEAIELLVNHGIKGAVWLPFACDPDYHRPVNLTKSEMQALSKEVVFVGGFSPNRWHILRELGKFSIGIWGPHWSKVAKEAPKNCHITELHVNYTEWVKMYCAAKMVVIIHYQDGITPCYQASPKVYEAMAVGLPVISTWHSGIPELVVNGKSGFLVPERDIDAMAEKLEYLIANPQIWSVVGRAGRRHVEDNFNIKKLNKSLVQIYQSLL